MLKFKALFPSKCSVIGMVHAAAFPVACCFNSMEPHLECGNYLCAKISGTPRYGGSIQQIIDKACKETEIYLNNNVNGILVENMNDIPYIHSKYFGPETPSLMTRICSEIRKIVPNNIPCGVQVLTAGNREAIAVAQACSFNFIRSEGFVFSHIGDEGFINADAGHLLRYRKHIDAENILVFTDIKKKHCSHSMTNDVSLIETAKAAEYFLSDGLILTGATTGDPASVRELYDLSNNSNLPIIIGSGVTYSNVHNYFKHANALIIGSHFKDDGFWENDVIDKRVKLFMDLVNEQLNSN